jgi:large subunit ribosomal protein L1
MAKKQTEKPEGEAAEAKTKAAPAEGEAPAASPDKEKKKAAPKAKAPKPAEAADKGDPEAKPAAEAAPKGKAPAKTAPAAAAAPAPPLEAPGGEPSKKKGKRPGVAPPLGKKLKNHLKMMVQRISKQGPIPVKQAIAFLKQHKRAKFDETVEIHMALGIDPKQSDQMVRGSVALPNGIGKTVRLLVFAQGENAAKAKEAGADFVGADDLAKKIQGEGWLEFDMALATPDMMSVVGRLGKILGPRGLMPTPKAGTVITGDVAGAVREFKAGKVEYRADAGGNVHAPVGKLSFDENKLLGNISAFIEQIRAVKPSAAKGNYIKSITVSATMSPGIPVSA